MSSILKGLNELSNDTLASYKKKAGADATASDKAGNYKRGDKRMSGIVKATKKQFANDNKGLKEDFEDMPDELMDPAVWKTATLKQKYKAVVDAGLIEKPYRSANIGWMNNEINPITGEVYNDSDMPGALKNGELDLNKVYRKALAKYQDRKHSSDLTSQDREHELTIGTAGRAEMIRKVDELAEMKRVTLRNERLQDEEVAFQRAETIQQRKDEMKKIADKYQHDLTVIDKEHRNNMESIRTGNNHEIKKIDKEHDEARREREHSSSESDKDRAEREREREQNRPKPEKPKPVDMPEPEPEQEPEDKRGNKFDQDTGEPMKPNKPQQSNQWHTSQQLTAPTKPNKKNDDVTDVEPKPNKPLALGNSVKEAGPGVPFRGVGGAFNRGDDERHDLDTPKQKTEIWGLKINGKVWQKDGQYVTFPSREAALLRRNSLLRTNPNLEIGLVTQGGASPAPTKPAPQKPLMAVSLDKWKEAVLKRYPEARFMTQKMINGATIASDRSGQVGIYDPKNSYAKVGPETQQGVAEEEEDKMDSRFKKTEWMPLMDAIKILKHYGATPEEYMGHEMFPYYDIEGNRKYLEDITWNADNSKNVRVSLVNQAVRELKAQKQGVAEEKQRLDPSCWKGYKKQGTKMKGDTRVNNCVPVKESSIMQGVKQLDEGWKEKLSAAALAGSMALGSAGASARVTPDGQGGFTGGLKPTATVTAPDNTPPATAPTATSDTSDPFKGLARADSADRQAKTITVGGKEYGLVELSPTDIRPRGGQRIVVPQGVLGERGIGNYMGILAGDRVFVISKN